MQLVYHEAKTSFLINENEKKQTQLHFPSNHNDNSKLVNQFTYSKREGEDGLPWYLSLWKRLQLE